MSEADNPAPPERREPQPGQPAAAATSRRVSWLTAFIVVAAVLLSRGFMHFGPENLTWRDATPYVLIGLAFMLAAIVLTRARNRDSRS